MMILRANYTDLLDYIPVIRNRTGKTGTILCFKRLSRRSDTSFKVFIIYLITLAGEAFAINVVPFGC